MTGGQALGDDFAEDQYQHHHAPGGYSRSRNTKRVRVAQENGGQNGRDNHHQIGAHQQGGEQFLFVLQQLLHRLGALGASLQRVLQRQVVNTHQGCLRTGEKANHQKAYQPEQEGD